MIVGAFGDEIPMICTFLKLQIRFQRCVTMCMFYSYDQSGLVNRCDVTPKISVATCTPSVLRIFVS